MTVFRLVQRVTLDVLRSNIEVTNPEYLTPQSKNLS